MGPILLLNWAGRDWSASTLLEQALARVVTLPPDAIASQILESLADEAGWKKRFADKRLVIRLMALEALDERSVTLGV